MKPEYSVLEKQKAECAEKVRGLEAYIRELTETASKHGTDTALLEEDLAKARFDAEFYGNEEKLLGEQIDKELGHTAYWVYEDAAGEWRWQLKASNERVIADSGEGYRHKHDCLHAIALVKDSKDAPVKEKG
jgi:uncharacterized protein